MRELIIRLYHAPWGRETLDKVLYPAIHTALLQQIQPFTLAFSLVKPPEICSSLQRPVGLKRVYAFEQVLLLHTLKEGTEPQQMCEWDQCCSLWVRLGCPFPEDILYFNVPVTNFTLTLFSRV